MQNHSELTGIERIQNEKPAKEEKREKEEGRRKRERGRRKKDGG